ncbi:hypothetical protein JFN87_09990 [Streptomyces bomunensis]|uniref:EcsC family protein n=1 Tax=Streptomyces montanisoli TaxID=2798581 RepID=A0A940M7W3_9ACTN|nr:hypothetical protein [Streptomyces montanisoli]MBP0457829.1 hypothetical protein [Streptomyces montanisoli]
MAGDPFRKRRFRPAPSPDGEPSQDRPGGTDAVRDGDAAQDGKDRLPSTKGRFERVRRGVRKGGSGAAAGLGFVADRILEIAPRIPVRDLATLRGQFPGLGPEEIADKLVAGAATSSATVGAGVGAAAMLPVPPALPAELAAEITAVAAIEIKLIAELHEVYGQRPPGSLRQRGIAYVQSWTEERGVDVTKPATFNGALSGRMKRELRQQIMKRTVRSLPNLVPFMIGAAVGAMMNRRDTKHVAEHVRDDLRRKQVAWDALPALPPLERPADPPPELPGDLHH